MKTNTKTSLIVGGALMLALSGLLLLAGCQTTVDPVTGKKTTTLTPAAKAEAVDLGKVAMQAVANAAVTAATDSVTQLVSTGKVNSKELAAAELSGLASNAQGYVGEIVSSPTLTAAISNPSIAAAVTKALPQTVTVTQSGVNALNAAAAKLYPTATGAPIIPNSGAL